MSFDISVQFPELRREADGSVTGKVTLNVKGDVLGLKFDKDIDARNFTFPRGGEKTNVYDEDFGLGHNLSAKVTASVYEHTPGQCCIKGHVHVSAPIGGGVGKDLDENCKAIPG